MVMLVGINLGIKDPPVAGIDPDHTDREVHLENHYQIHWLARNAVVSGWYATLQEAVDDAVIKNRILIVQPGNYLLDAPLRLYGNNTAFFGYGATLTPSAPMESVLEIVDCQRTLIAGFRIFVPSIAPVTNAIYMRRYQQYVHKVEVTNVVVDGFYKTGVRVGEMGIGDQLDMITLSNISCYGRAGVSETGIYIGTHIWGNNVLYTVKNVECGTHITHIHVDHTDCVIRGGNLDQCSGQDILASTSRLVIDDVRSEQSPRFLELGGPAGYYSHVLLRNIDYRGAAFPEGGYFITTGSAGLLELDGVYAINSPHQPIIFANPGAALALIVNGFAAGLGEASCPLETAFEINNNTTLLIRVYTQLGSISEGRGIVAQIVN